MDNNIIGKLIRGEKYFVSNGSAEGRTVTLVMEENSQTYEMIDYYEMNLYTETNESKLKSELYQIRQKNDQNIRKFKNEINLLVTRLEAEGIDYCILAGIPLAERYHDRPELRLQEDIDFFVSNDDLEKIDEIMVSCNYSKWNYKENRKHITYIKEGKNGNDLSLDGKCAVKFYKRMTDIPFAEVKFSDMKDYLEVYAGYKILKTEAAMFHLILHAHYYDMHPKILCDIYMVLKNGNIDMEKLKLLVGKYGISRLYQVVMEIMSRLGIEKKCISEDIDIKFLSEIYVSKLFWEKVFIRLNEEEMTLLRCYLYDAVNYRKIYSELCEEGLKRRVSPVRKEFVIN